MRNILQYPVKPAEVVDVLSRALSEEQKSQAIGGIDGMVLADILKAAKTDPTWFTKTFQGIEYYKDEQ
jgi:hypothetical protein